MDKKGQLHFKGQKFQTDLAFDLSLVYTQNPSQSDVQLSFGNRVLIALRSVALLLQPISHCWCLSKGIIQDIMGQFLKISSGSKLK